MISSILFSVALFVLASVALAVLIFLAKGNRRWLAIAIPIVLMTVAASVFTINGIMGLPRVASPTEKFTFLDYATDGKKIWIWIVEKGAKHPITIEQPYSKEKHKKLQEAKDAKSKGAVIVGEPTKLKDNMKKGEEGQFAAGDFVLHQFNPVKDGIPKDPAN